MIDRRLALSALVLTTLGDVLCLGCSGAQSGAPSGTPIVPISGAPSAAATNAPSAPKAGATAGAVQPPESVTEKLGGGCDEVKRAYLEECAKSPGKCPAPDSPPRFGANAYGAVLNRGSYLNTCNAPTSMEVKICAAVRDGHAIGVTVTTTPGDQGIAACIGREVQALSFPSEPGLAMTMTSFAAQ